MIRKISIENYKSIAKLELELGRVTVLVGENGSGKGNFTKINQSVFPRYPLYSLIQGTIKK